MKPACLAALGVFFVPFTFAGQSILHWKPADGWRVRVERYFASRANDTQQKDQKRQVDKKRADSRQKLDTALSGTPGMPNDIALSLDPRLRIQMSVGELPTLDDILAALRAATGLEFVLGKNLQNHQPDMGRVLKHNVFAWEFMTSLAETDLVNGYWEKTDSGYRLTGKSRAFRLPTKQGGPHYALWLLFGVLLLLNAGVLLHRRMKTSPSCNIQR